MEPKTDWPKVVLVLGLTVGQLIAGVALVALGERDLGLIFLGAGGGAMAMKAGDAVRPKKR